MAGLRRCHNLSCQHQAYTLPFSLNFRILFLQNPPAAAFSWGDQFESLQWLLSKQMEKDIPVPGTVAATLILAFGRWIWENGEFKARLTSVVRPERKREKGLGVRDQRCGGGRCMGL